MAKQVLTGNRDMTIDMVKACPTIVRNELVRFVCIRGTYQGSNRD